MTTHDPGAPPPVTIIIPVYNHYEYTRRCLKSVERLHYANLETIVVDNASTDATPHQLPQEFPQVRILRNPRNLGYAAAINRGVRESKGEYLMFLNNDTEILDADLLEVLVGAMESDVSLAVAGPRIVDYDDPTRVVFDGGRDKYGFLEVTGVALLLRSKSLEAVGLFDEAFFAYYEDRDLFARLRKSGWNLRHVPSVRVAHKGSVTAVLNSPFYHYYHNRNLVVLLRRHASLGELVVNVAPKWSGIAGWFLFTAFRRKDWRVLRAWTKGLWDGLRMALADQPAKGPPLRGTGPA